MLVYIGLSIVGIRFSVILGVIAAVFAMVPIVGPILGAIPGLLVTLATSPGDTLWVLLVYLAAQLLENTLLAPRVHGQALNMHPIVVMFVLMAASQTAGMLGIVLGLPVAAAGLRIFAYFRNEANWTPAVPASEDVEAAIEPPSAQGDEPDPSFPEEDKPSEGQSDESPTG